MKNSKAEDAANVLAVLLAALLVSSVYIVMILVAITIYGLLGALVLYTVALLGGPIIAITWQSSLIVGAVLRLIRFIVGGK